MKCSEKRSFIYILLIIFIGPAEGKGFSLFLQDSSLQKKGMDFHELLAANSSFQDSESDSFHDAQNVEMKPHKIVKKQMVYKDYEDLKSNRRSTGTGRGSLDRNNGQRHKYRDYEQSLLELYKYGALKTDNSPINEISNKVFQNFLGKRESITKCIKRNRVSLEKGAEPKRTEPTGLELKGSEPKGAESKATTNELPKGSVNSKQKKKLVGHPCKHFLRFADKCDRHFFYECEAEKGGAMKIKHKMCPEGEIFAPKYLECLKAAYLKAISRQKRVTTGCSKKANLPDPNPEPDSEPANEWLDIPQGNDEVQKIPSEFKPKQKPKLKLYYLRGKRKQHKTLKGKIVGKRHASNSVYEAQRKSVRVAKVNSKRQNTPHHHPRSYLIRINKKDGEYNHKDKTRESNESYNEEEDDDSEEEDNEDEGEDDDEENEEDSDEETKSELEKPSRKDTLKQFFKSAKAAVTNRARFNEKPYAAPYNNNVEKSGSASEKNGESSTAEINYYSPDTKVLIDANIKVDSAISSAFKSILSKRKEKSIKERNSKAENRHPFAPETRRRINSESIKTYENLIRSNPRVKRYFLSTLHA